MSIDLEASLSQTERSIFELIRSHARTLGDVVPRVAGGWVRDKLMGNSCFDMDIALSNISGYEFALGLSESATDHKITTVHVIKNNHEKSKHLETAVVRINDICVDFVGLRSETYSDARVPCVVPATPEEDSFRRDLTINSLFYNLFTNAIEDHTGRGIEDIRNKLLATPLDPKVTLFDDPLRIVRILRFHSKLRFDIDEKIYNAMEDEEIRKALARKVSNERIYIEISKMIHYSMGQYGLLEIIRRRYVEPIFKPPVLIEQSYEQGVKFIEAVEEITNLCTRPYRREILCLYTILCFFSRQTITGCKKSSYCNTYIMKVCLPSSKAFVKTIDSIEKNLTFLDTHDLENLGAEGFIRIVRYMGEIWYESLIIYCAIEHMKNEKEKFKNGLGIICKIIQESIEEYYKATSIVDASSLIRELGIVECEMRFYIEEGIVYQLLTQTDDPRKIVEHLKRVKGSRMNL
ncbi:tRNA nucleotidyltransferase/poly(A) polymerase [Ordospora colligata]|uniref:tRNA nucleotidyltransferase/poly(A) polymerase n=1 Tax=Ordospora colligata OC4 TaxID=1354746 RepID=A0A0B2UL64_9MICR|nr:tRNA nucleotidyltransferase/poly(A) polymerase [Ordospora colligata OC4]KHN70044.1 tRNA nucleotidyltransferase/poly(A) polymerase [Ordospora colligata OC4]TBU16426.1 tRNA nucleotidyltransferase/poly(A) polymerase [Ordospora colligata]TBU16611.1 tRNA nucleotidyltransferase/poly(A) polymerase [Ordospora colligata]TBU19184.1 tRNA nucleotidyltransferase/poly(A) polymerase [Ordospora colligata]